MKTRSLTFCMLVALLATPIRAEELDQPTQQELFLQQNGNLPEERADKGRPEVKQTITLKGKVAPGVQLELGAHYESTNRSIPEPTKDGWQWTPLWRDPTFPVEVDANGNFSVTIKTFRRTVFLTKYQLTNMNLRISAPGYAWDHVTFRYPWGISATGSSLDKLGKVSLRKVDRDGQPSHIGADSFEKDGTPISRSFDIQLPRQPGQHTAEFEIVWQ